MTLIVAKVIDKNIFIFSDTKLTGMRQKIPLIEGAIKVIILSKQIAVGFAGVDYFANQAIIELERAKQFKEKIQPQKEITINWLSGAHKQEWEALRKVDDGQVKLLVELRDICLSKRSNVENAIVVREMKSLVMGIIDRGIAKDKVKKAAPKLSSQIKAFARHKIIEKDRGEDYRPGG